MCLTNVPENRIPFSKPEGYDPSQYELLARVFESGWRETFGKFDPIPNGKTDTNNHGSFSTDNIGMNYDFPEASYEDRERILAEHAGEIVLVSGHSNTVPEIVAALGAPEPDPIDDAEYDNLYVVSVSSAGGEATVLHLHFGRPAD